MPKIFVVRADNPGDRSALDRSLVNPVERQLVIQHFSDATYPELIDIERRGRGFYAWGLTADRVHVEQWFQMSVGDFVLITYKGAYRHYAKVLGRYDNAPAARAIWGDGQGNEHMARELLFFLTEPIPLNLPASDLTDYLPDEYTDIEEISPDTIDRIEADYRSVERFFRRRLLNTDAGGPILDMSGIIQMSERDKDRLRQFDPESSKEGRARLVETIITRRGQPTLRRALMNAYNFQCAITACNASDALEVAYIVPYRGKHTHHASNALLLRADVHTLFDLGKLAIDTRTMTVILADELLDTSYRLLAGRPLRFPDDESRRPSKDGLDLHRRLAGL